VTVTFVRPIFGRPGGALRGIDWQAGAVLVLARWGAMGDHNSSWGPGAKYAAELRILLVYFAAELRILLVYLSESLGMLGQNGVGALGAHFSLGGRGPPDSP